MNQVTQLEMVHNILYFIHYVYLTVMPLGPSYLLLSIYRSHSYNTHDINIQSVVSGLEIFTNVSFAMFIFCEIDM